MLFPQNRRNALAVENQASLSKTSANASEWLLRENTWLGSRYKLSSSLLLHSQVKVNLLEESERGAFMYGGSFMSLTVPGLLALSNSALVSLAEQRKCLDHINLGSMDLTSQSSVKEKSIVLYWRAPCWTRSSAIISLVFVNIEFYF